MVWPVVSCLARGGSVILTESESVDREITVQIPQECQPMTVNGGVQNGGVALGLSVPGEEDDHHVAELRAGVFRTV